MSSANKTLTMHPFVNQELNKKLSIVTVNFKTADLVMQSIDSVFSQESSIENLTIYIVENDSQDGSEEKLVNYINNKNISHKISLISMPKNGGFGYGSNAGIRQVLANSAAEYIMLLNPDTVLKNGAVSELLSFLEAHPNVGIAGSQLENIDGHSESSAHRFHSPITELVEAARLDVLSKMLPTHILTFPLQKTAFQCDWVSGASMMVRRKVFEDIGLLDESFFLYFEEVDFFFRAKKAGWETWFVPQAKVMHIEGAATGINLVRRRARYWYESRRRLFIKHYGVSGLVLADFLWVIGRISYLARRFLKLGAQQQKNDPKWLMFDLLSGDIISILSGSAWRLQDEKII